MAASPVTPSFSAAHIPSSRLRRASALNFCSSSRANFFSKPSSRLSKVVILVPIPAGGNGALRCGGPVAHLDRGGESAKQRAVKPQGKRYKLGPTGAGRLCWKGQSDRLPSGLVLVLFPVVKFKFPVFTAAPSWVVNLVIRSTPNSWISTKHGTSQ